MAARTAGRMRPAAQPQMEFTINMVVPADDHLIGTTGCVLDQPARPTG
jgi:hypothetical protein